MNNEQTIKINDKKYKYSQLGDTAKKQLVNIEATDQEIQRLQILLNITQTARNAYAKELKNELPKNEAPAKKKKDIIIIDEKRYELQEFNDDAKAQLASLQQADLKIKNLQNDLAMTQTAKNSYYQALLQELK